MFLGDTERDFLTMFNDTMEYWRSKITMWPNKSDISHESQTVKLYCQLEEWPLFPDGGQSDISRAALA